MSKELIKEAMGITTGTLDYDMRPRYDADTYIEILNWSKKTNIKPNPLLRVMTKMILREFRDLNEDAVRQAIKRMIEAD